jgi:GMP synthase PP-ATPase subunit
MLDKSLPLCYNKDTKREEQTSKRKELKIMYQNTIYTDEEYMAQGFTAEECPKIRRHDELFNRDQKSKFYNVEPLTKEEREEMYRLVEELGL